MSTAYVVSCVLLMTGVTYMIHMLPVMVLQRWLEGRFVRSSLAYVPYAVLSAMIFPRILYSMGSTTAPTVGLLVAMTLVFRSRGFLVVALDTAAVVLLTRQLLLAGLLQNFV